LISELLDLPEQVHRGDFVLNLSEGVTADKAERTLADYVVTPQLADAFDNALGFIKAAVEARGSKAAYLHGSFGSGKSHFMAVLHLLLQHDSRARAHEGLERACVKHEWVRGKRFLLVPYHLMNATGLEPAILGGYVDHVRRLNPEAPWPGVYLAEDLFADARRYRENVGDEKFFTLLGGAPFDPKWGKRAQPVGWTAEKFAAAMAAPPGDELRGRLAGDLVKHLFQGYHGVSAGRVESFVSLDKGMGLLSRHARDLGYDALILFLDELILWLAQRAANPQFVHGEIQKMSKLVESQTPDRPVPIVSFVARQRDLRDLVGKNAPGAEQLNFADALRHWEGRFHTIVLEDRNLPVIAEKRVLRPRNEACRRELKEAFEQAIRVKPEVLETLLTHEGDREMFRQVYPFSPALVQTLVAVSSVLQRERTALKIMLQLLVEKRRTLKVGDLIPCGDLWDMVAHGEEAFSDVMRASFENAKRLYHNKLRPILEELNDVNIEHDRGRAGSDPELAKRLARFDADDRLVKTLLLSAMVPEVEPLKNLTAARLAALNHGTIKVPPGVDAARIVLNKLRTWASRVGEIRVGEGPDPVISLQVVGVDTEAILEKARVYDNAGNRVRKIRELLFASLGVEDRDQMFSTYPHPFAWRGSRRRCDVVYENVRQLPDASLRAEGEEWKVVIDWPFDDPGHDPVEDHAKLDGFLRSSAAATRTLVWLPAFFSVKTQGELGKLVILDHLLRGDNLDQHAQHLSLQDRLSARQILENQQSALEGTLRQALGAAYGIVREPPPGTLDATHEPAVRSLDPSFTPQPPVGADLGQALAHLLDQAMTHQFPDHPHFEREVKKLDCEKVLAEVQKAARSESGHIAVDRALRPVMKLVVNPLGLGHAGEQYFHLEKTWATHFNRQLAAARKTTPTARELREWMDLPRPRGLAPEVGNLLILTFAEQTNRSFRSPEGRPLSPSLESLPDDIELPLQPLPEPDEWEEATRRAREVFGIKDFDSALLTAANVAALASKVEATARGVQESCHGLVGEVRQALARLNVSDREIDRAPRVRTALAVDALLSGLLDRDPTVALQHLARSRLETSARAMSTSLARAAALVRALRDTARWNIFDHIAHLEDERLNEAQGLLQDLRKILEADEYVETLESHLDAAQVQALRLLAPRPKLRARSGETDREKTSDGTSKTWRAIDRGHKAIDAENQEVELARLAALLRDGGGRRRLVVDWVLEREEESP
jgi:hypothetical protein